MPPEPEHSLEPFDTTLETTTALRFLLIALGTIIAFLLLEFPAFINVLDYRTVIGTDSRWGFKATNLRDPELGHIRRPHWHVSGGSSGGALAVGYDIPASDLNSYRWDVKYDRNGFRNDHDLEGADTIVIGDSFVEEITIPDGQLMTSLLANLQGKVVGNLGQYGYGPREEVIVLKRYGLALRPRTVVWMFTEANDLQDVMNYDWVMQHRPDWWHAYLARSLARNAFRQVRAFLFPPPKPPGVQYSGVFRGSNGRGMTIYFQRFPLQPLTKADLGAIDVTRGILAEASKLCAAQGARLVFVFIPDKFRVLRPFCQFPAQSVCRNWIPSDMPERLRKAVESISPEMGYLDLTPILMDAAQRGVLPYYVDDDHWTPEAHKIAADAINDYLSSKRAGHTHPEPL